MTILVGRKQDQYGNFITLELTKDEHEILKHNDALLFSKDKKGFVVLRRKEGVGG